MVVCVRHLSLSYTEQKFAGHHSIASLPVKLDANAGRLNCRALDGDIQATATKKLVPKPLKRSGGSIVPLVTCRQ